MKICLNILCIASALLIAPSSAFTATNYTSVWSVGDSLTDTGRTYNYFSKWYLRWLRRPYGEAYYKGHFSNGPVWTEYISGRDNGPGLPGQNYAWGGAITGTTTVCGLGFFPNTLTNWLIPSMEKQVADDLLPALRSGMPRTSEGATDRGRVGNNPLLTIWIGGNNFRVPAEMAPSGQASRGYQDAKYYIVKNVPEALQNIHATFTGQATRQPGTTPDLVTYYAPTTPDLSITPKFSGMNQKSKIELSAVIGETNRELKKRLYRLNDDFSHTRVPGRIVVVDAAAMMKEMIDNPADFQLTNATDSCLNPSTGSYAGNCNKQNVNSYFYLDDLHPTTYVHEMLAAFATNTDRLESGAPVTLKTPYVANIEWRDQIFPGEISGPGRLIKRGESELTLGAINRFTGGVRIDQGAIRIYRAEGLGDPAGGLVFRGGNLHGSGSFTLRQNITLQQPGGYSPTTVSGTFDVDAGYTMTLAGPMIYGDGNLAKAGLGTLDIRSRIAEARDSTFVESGVLLINSPDVYESTTIVVDAGAALGGAGRIKGSIINNGNILAGQNGGQMNITGDYTQSENGVVVIGAIGAQPAYVQVNGNAHVAGAVTATITAGDKFLTARQLVIHADDGVTGAFQYANTTSPFVAISLVHDTGSVSAVLKRDFELPAATTNEHAIGAYLNRVYREAPQGDLDRVFEALDTSGQGQGPRQALHTLSGATVARSDDALVAHQAAVLRPVLSIAAASRRRDQGLANLLGANVKRIGDTEIWAQMSSLPWRGRRSSTSSGRDGLMSAGFGRGWEMADGQQVTAGVAVSHGQIDAEFSGDHNRLRADTAQVSGYAAFSSGRVFIDAALGYGITSGKQRRMLAFGKLRAATSAHVRSLAGSASIRGGVSLQLAGVSVEPSIGLDWIHMARREMRETGAGAASLIASGHTIVQLAPSVGVDIFRQFYIAGVAFEPAVWARLDTTRAHSGSMRHGLAGAPEASFLLAAPRARDRVGSTMGASLSLTFGKDPGSLRLFANYARSRDSARTAHSFTGGMTALF